MFKMKGPTFFNKKSPFKDTVPTKKETVKAGWRKSAAGLKKESEAGKSGDVLTANILRTKRKKSYEK